MIRVKGFAFHHGEFDSFAARFLTLAPRVT